MMKIDVLFALPGPENPIKGDKLLVVAAATEHEDPRYLKGVVADVAEAALGAGAYRAVRQVTLELDESLVLALLKGDGVRIKAAVANATVNKGFLN